MTEQPTASPAVLVTWQELRDYIGDGTTWTTQQQTAATNILSGVQGELEVYLNRTVTPIHVRETVRIDTMGFANLRYTPVQKFISALPIDQTRDIVPVSEVQVAEFVLDASVSRSVDLAYAGPVGDPMIVPGGIFVGWPGTWYVIEYIAGVVGDTSALKQGILRVAAREWTKSYDDTINFRDDNAERAVESDQRPKGWTEDELRALDRFRRRIVA